MDIQTVKDFTEWSEGFPFVEVHDTEKWQIVDNEIYWCYTGFLGDEWEYSSEVLESVLRKDGVVLVNIDNRCGGTITLVFLESMEVQDE